MKNASTKIRLFINEEDYSDFLVEGSVSDDSAYTNNIITCNGTIKLAGSADILDYNKTKFPVGSSVSIYATLANGNLARLAKGSFLILESSIDIKEPSITFQIGCSLSYLAAREANYLPEIEQLIDTFIPSDIKSSFIIKEKNLSALNNLLDLAGIVIFQNPYGTIQKATKFGGDGIGGAVSSPKLVSFDKHSTIDVESLGGAIEELPSAVVVRATTEVPVIKITEVPEDPPVPTDQDDDDDDGEDDNPDLEPEDNEDDVLEGKPPPFISSSTTRTIKVPDIHSIYPFYSVRNLPQEPESQTEAIPACGSISDPEATTTSYGYTVTGAVIPTERTQKEVVTQGSYTSYEGPGNQVDFEYDFEHCSAGTYASGVLSGLISKYSDAINEQKAEAQALCGKVNAAFTQRDDFNSREAPIVYFYEENENGERVLVDQEVSEEAEVNQNAQEYYDCIGNAYLDAAKGVADGVEALASFGTKIVDGYLKDYGYSSFNITYYFYDSAGTVTGKITKNFIHPAASTAAQKATNALRYIVNGRSTGGSGFDEGLKYYTASGLFDYSSFRLVGKSFDQTVRGDRLITSHSIGMRDPERYLNLMLAQTTVTTYRYTDLYVTETVEVTDHQDPINSYKRVNYSSTGSKNPVEPDRIEIQRDSNGEVYTPYVPEQVTLPAPTPEDPQATTTVTVITEQEMVTEELEYRQAVNMKGGTTNVVSKWLGQPSPQDKEINLPLDFAPITGRIDNNGVPVAVNPSSKLASYQKILQRYAQNEALKIAADNSGFRITESGNRAELFGYHPYYPIALNLSSLGKRYGLRAASSSWVFDSNNVLCSIDCFRTSEITSSVDQAEISPYIYTVITKVEGVTVIAPATINIPPTGTSIAILTLPETGTLTLNGNSVSIGDTISISDISNGDLVYTPPTNDTTEFSIDFKVLDTNGNQVGSGDNIFPVDQYQLVDYVFADCGEFTDNTTNGGFNGGGGDFDLGTRPGGNYNMNAGDFDTGDPVVVSEPLPSNIGNSLNGEDNVDDNYGSSVVDQDGTSIGTDQLPGPSGSNDGLLEIEIQFKIKTFNVLKITNEIIVQAGWDYGFMTVELGTPVDNGTIASPSPYNLDFGTITAPLEPALSSGVT